uniref:peroxidase n=1 Tax=Lotus japonicus TaxID=34305 RepID=I3T288_LOTJA|nr:unknown [Lotus japonicus]
MAEPSSFSMTFPSLKLRLYFFIFLCFNIGIVSAQLSSDFYSTTCPNVLSTIKTEVDTAVNNEARMGASLLRLHFHDCFVQASQLTLISSFHHILYWSCIS